MVEDTKRQWLPHEDEMILRMHAEGAASGLTYQSIAVAVHRSANAVRCRWQATLKKRFEEQQRQRQ